MALSHKLLDQVWQLIAPLTGALHKGQAGWVAVVGGAEEYSGAPFFATISAPACPSPPEALCKAYPPDLVVHPVFAPDAAPDAVHRELDALLARLHVLVIGPAVGG